MTYPDIKPVVKSTNEDFDPMHDYFEDLKDDEKYKDKESGREFPSLRGLQRIAHTNRRGVRSIKSKIVKVPSVDVIKNINRTKSGEQEVEDSKLSMPDCIAAVVVTYEFNDGTSFDGAADASYKAVDSPYNFHLTAVADSKAEARAIRRAFNISQVSKEEIGSPQPDDDYTLEEQGISDTQIHTIKKMCERKGITEADVIKSLKLSGRRAEEVNSIYDLNRAEGAKAMKLINRRK